MIASAQISEIADDYLRHAEVDYVGLWHIASRIREDLRLIDNGEVRVQALEVVKRLIERGLGPGDYLKAGFKFWKEDDAKAIVERIDREWNVADGDPTLANPICWFAPRPQ